MSYSEFADSLYTIIEDVVATDIAKEGRATRSVKWLKKVVKVANK